jgi:Ca2+/Na+ antiporter
MLALVLLAAGAAIVALGSGLTLRAARGLVAPAAGWPIAQELLISLSPGATVTVLAAAGRDQTSLAAGTALGVVVFLFAALFGGSLIVARSPLPAPPLTVLLFPGGVLLATAITLADQVVTRAEGAGLIGVFVVYLLVVATAEPSRRRMDLDHDSSPPRTGAAALVGTAIGVGVLYVAATLLLGGAIRILERTTLAAGFVGAALVGAGASLREAARTRRTPEGPFRAVAALASGVLGTAALLRPLVVDAVAASALLAAAALYALVCAVFLVRGEAWRLTGLLVLGLYGAWLFLTATT